MTILYTLALLICLSAIGVVYRRTMARWVWESWPVQFVIKHIMPLRLSTGLPPLTERQFWAGIDVPQTGDIVVTYDKGKIGAFFTPKGKKPSSHVLWCKGRDEHGPILAEMKKKGYGEVGWFETCKHARRVYVLRAKMMTPEYAAFMVGNCNALAAMCPEYDDTFQLGNEKQKVPKATCAELPLILDTEGKYGIKPRRMWGTGYKYVAPKHMLETCDKAGACVIEFDSDDCKQGSV
jgi:hypothetical protein